MKWVVDKRASSNSSGMLVLEESRPTRFSVLFDKRGQRRNQDVH